TSKPKDIKAKEDKQIYYRNQILNPVIAEMLSDIKIKSTTAKDPYNWVSTIKQINRINEVILSGQSVSDDIMRTLLNHVGFNPTHEQLKLIQQENDKLIAVLSKRHFKDENDKVKWLQFNREQYLQNNEIIYLINKIASAGDTLNDNEFIQLVKQ